MFFKNKLSISNQEELIKKCSNCSICRDYCPTYLTTKRESKFAGGRMRIFRTFVEEGLVTSKQLNELMAFCTTCKRCEENCPIQLNYVEILETLRNNLAKNDNVMLENQERFIVNLLENKNPYGEKQEDRMQWANSDLNIKSSGSHAYFVGCTASYRDVESALNTAKILSNLLEDGYVLLKEEEYCCGSPFLRTGLSNLHFNNSEYEKEFKIDKYIKHNIRELKQKGIKEIICNCAGCYKTIKTDWPEFIDGPMPFDVKHITEFLAEKMRKNHMSLKEFPKTITYHDPCHLGRHMGIYEEPRFILSSIPGTTLKEMPNNRENALCCGAGGGFKSGFPDDALKIAKLRIEEAVKTGADIIATSCVFCKNNLNHAIEKMNVNIQTLNIEDIVVDLIK